eukprot:1269333-Karenia_brevis.AAC.1
MSKCSQDPSTLAASSDIGGRLLKIPRRCVSHTIPAGADHSSASEALILWRTRAVDCIRRMGSASAVLMQLEGISSISTCGGAIFGPKRPRTLQKRVRCWEDFEWWCANMGIEMHNLTTAVLVRYLIDRGREPCQPSVPLSISCAFRMLMGAAKYEPEPNWHLVANAVKDLERQLVDPLALPSKAPAFSSAEVRDVS